MKKTGFVINCCIWFLFAALLCVHGYFLYDGLQKLSDASDSLYYATAIVGNHHFAEYTGFGVEIMYVYLLHGLFLVLGNSIFSAGILQIILILLTDTLVFALGTLLVHKLCGLCSTVLWAVVSFLFLAAFSFTPVFLQIVLFLFGLLILIWLQEVIFSEKFSVKDIFACIFGAICFVVLTLADPVLFILLCLFVFGKQYYAKKKSTGFILWLLTVCTAVLCFGMLSLFYYQQGGQYLENVLQKEFNHLYGMLTLPTEVPTVGLGLEMDIICLSFGLLGIIGAFVLHRFKAMVLPTVGCILIACKAFSLELLPFESLLVCLCVVMGTVSIFACIAEWISYRKEDEEYEQYEDDEDEENTEASKEESTVEENSEESKEESALEEKTEESKEESVVEEKTEESKEESVVEETPAGKPLANPLAVPVRKPRKKVDFPLEVSDEKMCFDVEISDRDDFDMK